MAIAIFRYPTGEIHDAAPEDLDAGEVIVDGGRVQIYTGLNPAVSGDPVNFATEGVWEIDATDADAWSHGDLLFFDPATDKITDVPGSLATAGLAVLDKPTTTGEKALIDLNASVSTKIIVIP